ncbi:MAG: MinD/ParA family protein [Planctomycetota bacterium]
MDQAQRLRQLMGGDDDQAKRARVIAVTSGKGGVGKTNLSVGLGLAAADLGRRVILVDGDLGLANVDVLLDVQSRFNLSHLLSGEASVDEILVAAPGGVRILPGATGVSHMADLAEFEVQHLLRQLEQVERDSDLVIVDTGAGISRQVVQFCLASDEVVVVTTTEPPAIADAYAIIKVLGQADATVRLRLLVNRADSRACADQVAERIVTLARRFLRLDVRPLGFVPTDPHVGRSVMDRFPFGLQYPSCPAAISVRELARVLGFESHHAETGGGFFRRMTNLFREKARAPLREQA